ncbi:histone H2A-like [Contarinia nasturtii]|uniref:histone H2A-like n=1 Tax=Contarinia nasturtii TaxID=265458 RepID=UPI0012D3861E|nr:histone H2A-like [Contarinia nasturtii]
MANEQNLMKANRRKISSRKQKQMKLLFPVHHAHRLLERGRYAKHFTRKTSMVLAAVVQYFTLELLDLSAKIALKSGKKCIQPRFIRLAMQLDDDLNELFASVTVAQGGVVPDKLKTF